jgi:DNA modification methylase
MTTESDSVIRSALAGLADRDHDANVRDPPSPHPFPARMPAPLAEHLLKSLLTRRATVLDPMVGSGSTLVAARKLGHHGFGVDIDPLAVLISRTATLSYERKCLEQLQARILKRATNIRAGLSRASVPKQLGSDEADKAFIYYWFPNVVQRQLICLARAIREEQMRPLRDLAWIVFSSLIIAKENSVSYAIDVSRSRPRKDDRRKLDEPFNLWNRRFNQVVNRLPFIEAEDRQCEPQIVQGDARCLLHDSNSIDLVLTSPPYLNAIDYIRGHKFSLLWMGYDLKDLRTTRGRMIGTERGMWKPDGLPRPIERDLEEMISEEYTRAIARRYLSDLRYSLLEMRRVVRPGGLIALVLSPRIVDRSKDDSVDLVRLIAKSADLRIAATVLRPLKEGRRSLPPPATVSQRCRLAARMSSEAIVVLRKE